MHPERPQRVVVLHYHLFKNAGTSVDQLLKANFGPRWVTQEFPARGSAALHASEVAEWIKAKPDAVAFSSHTVELPPPEIPGVKVIPVIFVRHPLDRIASAYAFERKQPGDSLGAVLARHTSLQGYAEVRVAMQHDRQCRNFHTSRLGRMFPAAGPADTELARSLRAIEALPFVGVVDEFDASMQAMADLLRPWFPDFKVHRVAANVSRTVESSLAEKLYDLRAEIGGQTYDTLVKVNADDLALYERVSARFRRASGGTVAAGS